MEDVFLEVLELVRFRSYSRAKFLFGPEGAMIVGRNGSGKSNLLESISFLALGKSLRGVPDSDAAMDGEDGFGIYAKFGGEEEFRISVVYNRGRGKRIHIDDRPLRRISELLGKFQVVSFSPEEVHLLLRSPAGRRRLLDMLLSQVGGYVWYWQRYRRALLHRNRLLSEGKPSRRELRPWDLQVVKFGSEIVRRRMELVRWMEGKVKMFYEVLGGGEDVAVLYAPSFPVDGDILESFAESLDESTEQERRLGCTVVGPHRDDLSVRIGGRDLRMASQGQAKSFLLAWKLGEALFLCERSGRRPALLMDEVFSDLDSERSEALAGLLVGKGQCFVTAISEDEVPCPVRNLRVIRVDGRCVP